jgi:hypothetical protein
MGWRFGIAAACGLLLASCAPPHAPRPTVAEFDAWLGAEAGRRETFARFEARLRAAGVAGVVENYQLWRVDRIKPRCVDAAFAAPPEKVWPHIVPALRFVRDDIKPAIGNIEVVSAWRSPQFNACINGARASTHRGFFAVDLVPVNRAATRATLIERLCPLHARNGRRARIGLGIYRARRFHIDAHGFRGWGDDRRGASFPCTAAKKGNTASEASPQTAETWHSALLTAHDPLSSSHAAV